MTNLDINIPLSSQFGNYDPEKEAARYDVNAALIKDKYHYDKIIGKRKDDGALKLKELKPEHKQYVSCFINGMKGVEIAAQFNVAAITVYRVLSDPLARSLLGEFDESFKEEFKAMFPLVSNAIREGLEAPGTEMRLKAVDRWTKVASFLEGNDKTGEDSNKSEVLAATRLRMITMLQSAADALPKDSSAVIELEAVVVETS